MNIFQLINLIASIMIIVTLGYLFLHGVISNFKKLKTIFSLWKKFNSEDYELIRKTPINTDRLETLGLNFPPPPPNFNIPPTKKQQDHLFHLTLDEDITDKTQEDTRVQMFLTVEDVKEDLLDNPVKILDRFDVPAFLDLCMTQDSNTLIRVKSILEEEEEYEVCNDLENIIRKKQKKNGSH